MRFVIALVLMFVGNAALAQDEPVAAAPGRHLQSVWHFGRVTGDLERIIAFYHDLLGLGFRGDRDAPIPFYSVAAINAFVGSPAHAEFRAAIMPIPDASAQADPARQVYLEAFEYRNIERHQAMPALSDPGVSTLIFFVDDLDALVAAAQTAGVAFITANGAPAPMGTSRRAIMLRDPDGYPVELVEAPGRFPSFAPDGSRILGAEMALVVADLDAALSFYRNFIGTNTAQAGAWRRDAEITGVRALPDVEFRTATVLLPGTAFALELIEYRGIEQTPYRPAFQDIGFGHIAFNTNDIEAVHAQMLELGSTTLAASGTWTQINPNLRALYTRDNNGFHLEVIENPAPQ